jgi:hypothetical protein
VGRDGEESGVRARRNPHAQIRPVSDLRSLDQDQRLAKPGKRATRRKGENSLSTKRENGLANVLRIQKVDPPLGRASPNT